MYRYIYTQAHTHTHTPPLTYDAPSIIYMYIVEQKYFKFTPFTNIVSDFSCTSLDLIGVFFRVSIYQFHAILWYLRESQFCSVERSASDTVNSLVMPESFLALS